MKRYHRIRLVDIDTKIEQLYNDAGDNVQELMDLELALAADTEIYFSQKKMGKVRIYDKWGLKVGERILQLKNQQFENLPFLGVF